MKTRKIAVIIIAMVLGFAATSLAKEEQKQVSGTRQASCMIRIIADRQVISPDLSQLAAYVTSILQSSGIGIRASKEVLGYEEIPEEILQDMIKINFLHGQPAKADDFTFSLGLKIETFDAPKPAAQEFMQVIIEGLRQNLNRAFEDYKERLNQQIQNAEENAAKAERNFYSLQQEIRKVSGSQDLSRAVIIADINSLNKQIEKLDMDIAESKAYLEDIPKRIERIRVKVEEKLKTDTAINEMEKIIKNHQPEIDRVKRQIEAGQASSRDLSVAEENLARAQIDLARRKEEVQQNSGGPYIDKLNDEIADWSFKMDRNRNRFDSLLQRRALARELLEKTDVYEVLSIKADIAKRALADSLQSLNRLKQGADLVPPTITVMGAGE